MIKRFLLGVLMLISISSLAACEEERCTGGSDEGRLHLALYRDGWPEGSYVVRTRLLTSDHEPVEAECSFVLPGGSDVVCEPAVVMQFGAGVHVRFMRKPEQVEVELEDPDGELHALDATPSYSVIESCGGATSFGEAQLWVR